ncbi:hypothetical protein QR680_012189 [Steinernema hermaphroditum]|uniref:Uncharacterized protein n=1 Tax=Steinernema hermaphroditum TaxID=289476 RepID=A0AA39I179_9BILA|nr:hypothetical protein QR680_012189 [Steinernema hermaphroditum]
MRSLLLLLVFVDYGTPKAIDLQSEGFLTFRKLCRTGLVYDTEGTQNCNYDFNVKGCNLKSAGIVCQKTEFSCPFSEACVPLEKHCNGHYDCLLEEDRTQNCPMCGPEEFADGHHRRF